MCNKEGGGGEGGPVAGGEGRRNADGWMTNKYPNPNTEGRNKTDGGGREGDTEEKQTPEREWRNERKIEEERVWEAVTCEGSREKDNSHFGNFNFGTFSLICTIQLCEIIYIPSLWKPILIHFSYFAVFLIPFKLLLFNH